MPFILPAASFFGKHDLATAASVALQPPGTSPATHPAGLERRPQARRDTSHPYNRARRRGILGKLGRPCLTAQDASPTFGSGKSRRARGYAHARVAETDCRLFSTGN